MDPLHFLKTFQDYFPRGEVMKRRTTYITKRIHLDISNFTLTYALATIVSMLLNLPI